MLSDRDFPALTGLRGLAILWVIPHNTDLFPAAHNWLYPFAIIAHTGWIGVQLFFVLSGFLITGKLMDSSGSANYYSVFFGRRALRILPLYFLTLTFFLYALPHVMALSSEILQTYGQQPWYWLFLNNWTQPTHGGIFWFPHFWSLAVEEQFYLLWPFVIALVSRRKLLSACLFIIAIAFTARCAVLLADANYEWAYMITICRMDALAAGAIVAVIVRSEQLKPSLQKYGLILILLAIAGLLIGGLSSHLFSTQHWVTITAGYLILAGSLAITVYACVARPLGGAATLFQSLMSAGWLRSVGKYSFAIYVFHMPVTLLIGPWVIPRLQSATGAFPLAYAGLVTLISYLAAFASYHCFEKHFLRLKRLLVPASE